MKLEEQVAAHKLNVEEQSTELAITKRKIESVETLIEQESKAYTREILGNWKFYEEHAVQLGLCSQKELEYYTNTYMDVSSDLPDEFYSPVMTHISFIILRRLGYTIISIILFFMYTSLHRAFNSLFLVIVLSLYINDALGLVGYWSKFHRKKPVTTLLQRFIIRRYTIQKLLEEGVDVSLL